MMKNVLCHCVHKWWVLANLVTIVHVGRGTSATSELTGFSVAGGGIVKCVAQHH